jgi:hypothetical protein
MAGAISKSRSMCFPVLCGDAMTKQNSKAGGGDNAEYYINSIREIFWHSLVIRDVCLSAVIRGGSFLHTTYNRFVPTMPRCCRQRKHPRVVSLDAAAPGGASDCSS